MNWIARRISQLWTAGSAGRGLMVGGAFMALLLTFALGVSVGASGLGRGFRLPLLPAARLLGPGAGFPGHGAFGTIRELGTNTITISDRRSGQLQTIAITTSTVIQRGRREKIGLKDLSIGDRVMVIGSPSNGTMQARFVGVSYAPPLDLN